MDDIKNHSKPPEIVDILLLFHGILILSKRKLTTTAHY